MGTSLPSPAPSLHLLLLPRGLGLLAASLACPGQGKQLLCFLTHTHLPVFWSSSPGLLTKAQWGRRLCRGPEPGHCCLKGWQQLLRRSQLQSRTQGPPRPQNQESREELVPARILKIRPVTGEGPSLFRDVLWVTCGTLCCQSEGRLAETWERRVTLGPDLTVSREVE